MLFAYQARDSSGHVRSGEIRADTADEATQQLRHDGMYILSVEQAQAAKGTSDLAVFRKKIARSDIIYLTNQLAVMIDAGVSLTEALQGLAKQAENPTLKSVLEKITSSVASGDEFSLALSRYPKQFDKTYVNLVKASEASGTLGTMLERIAVQSRTELETKQKVRGALMYPAAMLAMCIGVSIFLLTYVFPKLMPMFEGRQMEVPTPTLMMISLSYALTHQWYWFILAAVAVITALVYASRQTWGRVGFDWCWLNTPIIGTLTRKVAISRSLRTLSTTINAGVPMLDALELSAGVANNHFYEQCWLDVSEQVTGGRQIHEALEGNKLIPATLLQMISSGEATGKLGQVLDKVSDYFDREVANTLKTVTSLIEPLMVAVMGGVIGFIALAMLLPIFKLSAGGG